MNCVRLAAEFFWRNSVPILPATSSTLTWKLALHSLHIPVFRGKSAFPNFFNNKNKGMGVCPHLDFHCERGYLFICFFLIFWQQCCYSHPCLSTAHPLSRVSWLLRVLLKRAVCHGMRSPGAEVESESLWHFSCRPDGIGTVTVDEKERFEEIKERLRVLLENQITHFRWRHRAQAECERNDFLTAPSYKQQSQKAGFECTQEFCISDTDLHRAVKHVYS